MIETRASTWEIAVIYFFCWTHGKLFMFKLFLNSRRLDLINARSHGARPERNKQPIIVGTNKQNDILRGPLILTGIPFLFPRFEKNTHKQETRLKGVVKLRKERKKIDYPLHIRPKQ